MPHMMLAANAASLLLDVSLKTLPVFAVAGISFLLLRRASAAARHALWLLVLAALLCLPLFCALLPRWSAPVLPATPRSHSAAIPAAPVIALPSQAVVPGKGADIPAMTGPLLPPAPVMQPPPARLPLTVWVCLLWLLGTLLVLGRTLIGLAAASRLVRHCRPIMGGVLVEASEQAQNSLSLPRALSLRVGPVAVPMTCGVRHPIILLPESAPEWPAGRLRAVLLHEAAHVKRLDWPATLLAQCVCALYWFHPLVWLAAARLRAEAESACDDLVLTCGVPAPDYAAHLLEIIRGLTSRRPAMPGTVAMAHRQDVSARLRTILDGHRATGGMTRRGLVLATVTVMVLLIPLAALHPIEARPVTDASKPQIPQPVRTATWITTTQVFDATGRPQKNRYSQPVITWVRRTPPAIATMGLPAGWTIVRSPKGTFIRNAQGRISIQPINQQKSDLIARSVLSTLQNLTHIVGSEPTLPTAGDKYRFGPEDQSHLGHQYGFTSTPWHQRPVMYAGHLTLLLTRHQHIPAFLSKESPPTVIEIAVFEKRWEDINTGRLLRLENDIATSNAPVVREVLTESHFRYNQSPPPGVFIWSGGPGTKITYMGNQASRVLPATRMPKTAAQTQANGQAPALAVLNRMYATYTAMHSFRCNVTSREYPLATAQDAEYEIERPNKIRFHRSTLLGVGMSGQALAVSDGKDLYVTCTEDKGLANRYLKQPLITSPGQPADFQYRYWFVDFGNIPSWGTEPDAGMPDVALGIRLHEAPYPQMSAPRYSLGKPTVIDFPGIARPVALDVVIAHMHWITPSAPIPHDPEIVTYYVGQRDHLLYQVTAAYMVGPNDWDKRTETYNSIEVNPKLAPSDFVFTPPPGSHEVQNAGGLFPDGSM